MEIKELGHVVLYVRDIERSRHFYGHTLGFAEVVRETPPMIATFSSGRTHHELLLIEVGPSAAPIGPGPRVGLYHIGFKVGDSLEELRAARDRLVEAGVPILGQTDHGWTKSIYASDPDGVEIELYVDEDPPTWRDNPGLAVKGDPLIL